MCFCSLCKTGPYVIKDSKVLWKSLQFSNHLKMVNVIGYLTKIVRCIRGSISQPIINFYFFLKIPSHIILSLNKKQRIIYIYFESISSQLFKEWLTSPYWWGQSTSLHHIRGNRLPQQVRSSHRPLPSFRKGWHLS
jgi:hypothetical protein